jgi:pilus assembly protein CpaE
MKNSILIVDDSEFIIKLISAALKADGYDLYTAESGEQALEIIKSNPPDLAILDVVLPEMDGYALCKILRKNPKTSHIPIIILTSLTDLENRLKAFDAGADDFIQKPFQLEELQVRIRSKLSWVSARTVLRPETGVQLHKMAVFSLRGGVGVSTLAVNLAIGFSQLWDTPTLLADMALVNGQDALMMNLTLRNTWADLGYLKPDEIEPDNLERVVLQHASGVDVLAAPRRCDEAELITDQHVQHTFSIAESKYKYLVMDLPHDFSFTTVKSLDMADRILLLVAPDLASVRCASSALNVFTDLDYPEEKVQLVLNWNFATSGLARKEIEKTLRKPFSAVIPNMPDTLVNSITFGKPVIQEFEKPEAALFEDLAYFWSKSEAKEHDFPPHTDAWKRVMDRKNRRQKLATSK